MRVGFVGTGSMGNPIARNLILAGHDLVVHDRDQAATRNLISSASGGPRLCPATIGPGR
jgi:3-hydroxyisobutyrate dehydrogenase-like beta-hydroxyacid dehydrogenase